MNNLSVTNPWTIKSFVPENPWDNTPNDKIKAKLLYIILSSAWSVNSLNIDPRCSASQTERFSDFLANRGIGLWNSPDVLFAPEEPGKVAVRCWMHSEEVYTQHLVVLMVPEELAMKILTLGELP